MGDGPCPGLGRPGLGGMEQLLHLPHLARPRPGKPHRRGTPSEATTPGAQAEFVCADDTVFGTDNVLPYGESISAGVLRCESADSGITCRDTKTGHGFSIARQAYQLF